MKDKIIEMKTRITQEQKSRHAKFAKIKPVKKWNISVEDTIIKKTIKSKEVDTQITQTVVKSPIVKWTVSYD
jgi:hypothetical protein